VKGRTASGGSSPCEHTRGNRQSGA
jgi:hypothetical protein